MRKGSKPVMTFMGLSSIRTAQIVAQTGLDGIIVDCEYGNISDDAMHGAFAAIASMGVSPLVRIRRTHADLILIKRALDAGAQKPKAIVANAKFPPWGVRGQGSAFPAIGLGIDVLEYIRSANETSITCIQIESRQGVENMEAICAIDGVDMLFIGPNDLALSLLGYVPAREDEPEFVAAVDKIVAAARRHGKWVARLSNIGALTKEHLQTFDTAALSYDVRAIEN